LSSNDKISQNTEQKADIQQATSHDLEANFYMDPNTSRPDTNYVKEFFEPAFETADERKQFYMLRNRATHNIMRPEYEDMILDIFELLKGDNMEQTVLTLCILDPAQETEI